MLTPVALGSNLTMIERTSPVFGRAVALKKDTWVRFTGEFIRSEPDCFRESSRRLMYSLH
jgi:hypothetical protein